MTKADGFAEGLRALFDEHGAATSEQQLALLRASIPQAIPSLIKPWSNVTDADGHPAVDITSVGKAELGVPVLMTYVENGERQILLCQSGPHYFRHENFEDMPERYSYPGGFANLVECEGSSFVTPKPRAEEPEEAGAREVEEEIRDADGKPVIYVDPERCHPLHHDIVTNKAGDPIILSSVFYMLSPIEVQRLKAHIHRLEESESYRKACAEHTKSHDSGLAEIHTVKFFSVHDAMTRVPFLYPGQEEHVRRLVKHENAIATFMAREGLGSNDVRFGDEFGG